MQSWGVFVIALYFFSTLQGLLLRYGAPPQFLKAVVSVGSIGAASWVLFLSQGRYSADMVVQWFTIIMSAVEATCVYSIGDAVAIALGVYLCKPAISLRHAPFARALIVYRLISTYGRGLAHLYHALLKAQAETVETLETLRIVARSVFALSFLANSIVYMENMRELLLYDIHLVLHVALFTFVSSATMVRSDYVLYRTLA